MPARRSTRRRPGQNAVSPNTCAPLGNQGTGATTVASPRSWRAAAYSRVSTKMPCRGRAALGKSVVNVRTRIGAVGRRVAAAAIVRDADSALRDRRHARSIGDAGGSRAAGGASRRPRDRRRRRPCAGTPRTSAATTAAHCDRAGPIDARSPAARGTPRRRSRSRPAPSCRTALRSRSRNGPRNQLASGTANPILGR